MFFPSFGVAEIHPFVALWNDGVFRPLRRATRGSAPLDRRSLFEKSDAKTFHKLGGYLFVKVERLKISLKMIHKIGLGCS